MRRNRRPQYDEYTGQHLGARITRFLLMLGLVFVTVLAVVAAQQLSVDSLALIIGIVIASVFLLPVVALLGYLLLRLLTDRREQQHRQPQQMTIPPIVMTMPQQALPPDLWGNPAASPAWNNQPTRAWETVGDIPFIEEE